MMFIIPILTILNTSIMSNPFSMVGFKAPRTSLFSGTSYHKLSYEIGKVIPLKFYDLSPGDHLSVDVDQLTRFAPMLAPVMQGYKLYVDAVACPYRLLWHPINGTPVTIFNADDFFNLRTPAASRPVIPNFTMTHLREYSSAQNYFANDNGLGTLFDYLGMPMFVDLTRSLSNALANYLGRSSFIHSYTSSAVVVSDFMYQSDVNWTFDFYTPSSAANHIVNVSTFSSFCNSRYSLNLSGDSFSQEQLISFLAAVGVSYVDAQAAYIAGVAARFLQVYLDPDAFDGSGQPYSLLPYYVYRRIIGDWYINTNLVDIDSYVHQYLYPIASSDNPLEPAVQGYVVNTLADAYYANDYFTSAFNTAQDGSQVMIPVNGSIRDLRLANRIQELKEKILYAGQRIVDQNLARFGVKPNDNRLDRCEVLNRKTFDVRISDVTQMSGSVSNTPDSNYLGGYAGQGYGLGQSRSFINYTASENTMVMILISLRPQAVYDGMVNKLYFKTSPYDFLQPEVAQVGEQVILKNELYPILSAQGDDAVFGYQRRYAEYMYEPSTIGGEFHSSMDFWTGARQFNNQPVTGVSFNDQFCKITDADNFNRVFAVPGAKEHIYSFFGLTWRCSRALPRYINYSL